MSINSRLKENKASRLLPAFILTILSFVMILTAVLLYSLKCPSEFNGNRYSRRVFLLDILALSFALITSAFQLLAFIKVRSPKSAYMFFWTRLGDYLAFFCALGGFLFQILDEYSLLGTILYPIVSGTVGDPVNPVLSACYFTSLILLLVSFIITLTAGILLKRKSHPLLQTTEIDDDKEVIPHGQKE